MDYLGYDIESELSTDPADLEDSYRHIELKTIKTANGEEFDEGSSANCVDVLCVFVGKISLGFSGGFIDSKNASVCLLATVEQVGENTSAEYVMCPPKRAPVAKIYKDNIRNVLYITIKDRDIPNLYVCDIIAEIRKYLDYSKNIIVFNSESKKFKIIRSSPMDIYDPERIEEYLFYVKSTKFSSNQVPKSANVLTSPNLIAGSSAGILSYAVQNDKSALILISYNVNETLDSISTMAFEKAIFTNESVKIAWAALLNHYSPIGKLSKNRVSTVPDHNIYM